MGNRRMTRLTNAFSKKAANHAHMMAIYFYALQFRAHPSNLESYPGDGRWRHQQPLGEMSDMMKVLEDWEVPAGKT